MMCHIMDTPEQRLTMCHVIDTPEQRLTAKNMFSRFGETHKSITIPSLKYEIFFFLFL